MGKIIFYDAIATYNSDKIFVRLTAEVKNALWSTNNYFPVLMDEIYPRDLYNGPAPKDLSLIRRWIERETAGEVIIKSNLLGGKVQVWAFFELEESAVQYKLTWGGSVG